MEAENAIAHTEAGILERLRPVLIPVLLLSVGYIDPGKWVATIEGGARFGFDLVGVLLLFNLAAILCQYVSARISVVTGRDLAQICSDEYDKCTCMLLGIQAELSAIALDLTLVLGVAHGLNLLFGLDLSTCVFLASLDAVLFPLFATLLENQAANIVSVCSAGIILVLYVFGVLLSQPEIPFSVSGVLTKLNGESALGLMSLLGANIMPHNFYLHSYLARVHPSPPNVSKSGLSQDHFLAILCVFSGIFLVNHVLMNSAANVFYNTGLILLTFQDAISLMEQVFRSQLVPVAFLLVLFLSNQISAFTWTFGGEAVLQDFLRLDIPGWLHRATIRVIAIIPALYCVWTSGAEGIYQLLIFTQVMVALMLPSSVIPLFRVASSKPLMGAYKISQFLELLALMTFMGMLGLNIIFMVELIFGSGDWVGNLMWNTGSGASASYITLLVTACASFCLTLWLAATPLKSASTRSDPHAFSWDVQNAIPEPPAQREEIETRHFKEDFIRMQEPIPPSGALEARLDASVANFARELPETIMDSEEEIRLEAIKEKQTNPGFITPPVNFYQEESDSKARLVPISTPPVNYYQEESDSKARLVSISTPPLDYYQEEPESKSGLVTISTVVVDEVADPFLADPFLAELKTPKAGSKSSVGKTYSIGNLPSEKDDDRGDSWEPKEPSKGMPLTTSSMTYDGPPSFKSLGSRGDDVGNSAGSLSRLAGLGRAARRQLASILDEFWGQLYDFHGQLVAEAKAKKLDVVLGIDSKAASSPRLDASVKEFSGYSSSLGGRGSETHINSSQYESPNQQRVLSPYGVQRGSSALWPNQRQISDGYLQNSNQSVYDLGERRYSSLRTTPSSEVWDSQPATVHGYQIASYLSRMAKDRSSDLLQSQLTSQATTKSTYLNTTNYRDPLSYTSGKKLQNGITSTQPPGFPNLAISRNTSMQTERSYYYDVYAAAAVDNTGIPANEKRYHSLPSISGLAAPLRDLYSSNKGAQWDGSIGYGSSVGRPDYEPSVYSSSGSRAGTPLPYNELSSSEGYRDVFPYQMASSTTDTGSLWSRQPFEQFGVADNKSAVARNERLGGWSNPTTNQDFPSVVDPEAKFLQSFRNCIVKLLKLEGSDWLFRQNDGADEELIDRVAAREKFIYEAETKNQVGHVGETLVSSVPHCGDGCVWRADLIASFGVWCIHRLLDLSLMESRPELWGKYTYVLNRLQGVIDLAFSKPRSPTPPCFCLQISVTQQARSSPPVSNANGMLPPAAKPGRGKCTNAGTLIELIKDVEIAISCRKGRSGTAAGDVAFPKGKENLASVLKRYKRRLSSKVVVSGSSQDRKMAA